jgi:glycosyltransferase involved in cell wall biosynthesis
MTRPTSTLTLIHDMGGGGAQAIAQALVADQLGRGQSPVLACTGGFRLEPLQAAGVPVVPMRLHGRRPSDLAVSVRRLRAALRRRRPALVHAHNVKATVVARLAAGRSVPILTTVHGVPDQEYPAAARLLRHAADHVVAVSEGVAERLTAAGLPQTRLSVIENGIVPLALPTRERSRAALGLPADAVVVLCLARMAPQKRHDLLLAAWSGLATEAHLLLAGDGPTRADIEATLARGAAPRVRLLGELTDVTEALAASDLVVLPTDWEGLPISLLEAMAAGLPVLTHDVGDLRRTLGEAARLVPAGSVTELRAGMDRLLASPHERAELGRRGRRLVAERYDAAPMLAAYRALTADLTGTPDPALSDASDVADLRTRASA